MDIEKCLKCDNLYLINQKQVWDIEGYENEKPYPIWKFPYCMAYGLHLDTVEMLLLKWDVKCLKFYKRDDLDEF